MTFEVHELRLQRTVVLTASRWEHIIRRHPEMAAHGPEIRNALTSADVILASTQRPNVELYYKRLREGRFGPIWLKVVVAFAEDDLGEVLTTFLVYNISGGEVLWLPPDLKLT